MLESSEQLNNQGVRLAFKGEYTEAIACLKRAITVEKENYLLWFNLALTYRDAGNFDAAKTSMEYALRLNRSNEEIIEALANLCISMGLHDDAMFYCITGLEVNDMNPHFWNTAGVIHFQIEEYAEAADFFEHAVSLSPHYYDALFNLKDTYEQLGNHAGIEECSRRLESFKGNN
ncbi:tetratricopeptide repeat protein [Treponema sp.]|uniref:tetratricopeptide repeat protein n=1 Tax=Treponema sp. TaxID=166 RepID=UPI00388D9F3B